MKFSSKDFFSNCDQILSFLRIWSHLLKKSLMENFIFCAVIFEIFHKATQAHVHDGVYDSDKNVKMHILLTVWSLLSKG